MLWKQQTTMISNHDNAISCFLPGIASQTTARAIGGATSGASGWGSTSQLSESRPLPP